MIDESTDFGARAARHLRDEIVVWLTTVTPRGSPLPMPVWFIWDGAESVAMYSQPGARVRNIEANPHVSLNFAGDGRGGDLTKYHEHISRIGMSPETFAERYSVPVRIELVSLRGH